MQSENVSQDSMDEGISLSKVVMQYSRIVTRNLRDIQQRSMTVNGRVLYLLENEQKQVESSSILPSNTEIQVFSSMFRTIESQMVIEHSSSGDSANITSSEQSDCESMAYLGHPQANSSWLWISDPSASYINIQNNGRKQPTNDRTTFPLALAADNYGMGGSKPTHQPLKGEASQSQTQTPMLRSSVKRRA